jgi:hypothetical protein
MEPSTVQVFGLSATPPNRSRKSGAQSAIEVAQQQKGDALFRTSADGVLQQIPPLFAKPFPFFVVGRMGGVETDHVANELRGSKSDSDVPRGIGQHSDML